MISTGAASAADIYVNGTGGSDTNDGSSWTHAKKSINSGTDAVTSGGTVHIANSIYNQTGDRGITINKDMTITGESQTGTIINAGGSDRIFTINREVTVTIQNLTLTSGNSIYGGAINNDQGDLTVENCTFTGNAATSADYGWGGAIVNTGSLTVKDSTFTDNNADIDGGAIYNKDGILIVNGSTFTGNTAKMGGAIYNKDGNGGLKFNRFYNNNAGQGSAIYSEYGNLDATQNWWGSNEPDFDILIEGNVNPDNRLFLKIHASPASIATNGTSTVTCEFFDGSGQSGPVPDGIPITFTSNLGTILNTATVDGKAVTTFTAGSTRGIATVSAMVDDVRDGEVTTQITIIKTGIIADVYVSPSGNDNNDGSKGSPFKTIAKGIDEVSLGGRVHIANGVYNGENNRGITITQDLTIIGESQTGTIIDAEKKDRIFYINNGVTVTLRDLTIRNGNITDNGGAINNYGTLTVIDSTFTGNTAISDDAFGGAIVNNGGSLTVIDSNFTGNTAIGGGAIYNDGGSWTVIDSTFTGNTAIGGGAIVNNGGSWTVIDSNFTGNTATYYGGAIFNYGGTWTVIDSNFTGNIATGTEYGMGGGAILNAGGSWTVIDSNFTGNTAIGGGAILNAGGSWTVIGSNFTGNTATYYGGAIYNSNDYDNPNISSSGFVNFSRFYNNTARQGNAIYCESGYVDATNNWWGSNSNPANISNLIVVNNGTVNANPWVVLTVTANSTSLVLGGTSQITADLNHNSAGQDITNQGSIPGVLNVTFTSTNGSVNPTSKTLVNGVATTTFKATNVGKGGVTVLFDGYTTAPVNLAIGKSNTTLTVNAVTGIYKGSTTLTATLKDQFNNPVNGVSVVFKVGSWTGTGTTNAGGIASVTYNPITQTPGNYTITTTFAGNNNYNTATNTNKLTINKSNTALTLNAVTGIYKGSTTLTATLKDQFNNPVNGVSVVFKVGSWTGTGTTNAGGIASVTYNPITQTPGNYTITTTFAGNNNYNTATNTNKLTVNKSNTTLTLQNPTPQQVVKGGSVTLSAILKDKNGSPVSGKSVVFTVGSWTGKATSNSNGVATVKYTPVKLNKGSYTIKTNFAGDSNYNISSTTKTLTVKNPLTVTKFDPAKGATNIAATKTITLSFSEAIAKGSNFNKITLKNSAGKTVTINTPTISGSKLTIKSKSKLAESKYTLTLPTGSLTDKYGNPLTSVSSNFSVGSSPTVKTSNPKNKATKVTRNKTIKLTFSENIKAGSNYSKITLVASNGSKVTITKSIKNNVLTISHKAKLKANTKYKLTLNTKAITDKAGNPLAAKTITFTTGSA